MIKSIITNVVNTVYILSSKMIILLLLLQLQSYASASSFNRGDEIDMYVNKIGPYFNPHETYHYYQLPVCRPSIIEHKSLTLGEVLDGDRMAKSLYSIKFMENFSNVPLCELTISKDEVTYLQQAIEENFYYEFVIDDIPVRDFIGHFEEIGVVPHSHKIYLWTHQHFNFYFNGDKIIHANMSSDNKPISINVGEAPFKYTPTYSVTWLQTDDTYEIRGLLLNDSSFFPRTLEIHWLSILNSCLLVFMLIGLIAIILAKVLRNDFARYNIVDDEKTRIMEDDQGWKVIHADVFRIPNHTCLLASILGVGCQFLMIISGLIVMALLGLFNVHRHGSMAASSIFLYALTSFISGYTSGKFYFKTGGKNWLRNAHFTTLLFIGPLFIVWSIQNTVAWTYHSTQALPVTTVTLIFLTWLCVGYPLTLLGSSFGKRTEPSFGFPCKTKKFPREIPETRWYQRFVVQCFIGGFLPFSSVSVEMYYVYSTLWGRDQYTLFGILALVFVILLSVTACGSITLTYFQLASEDYRWWWRSIFTSGSTACFVVIYSIFYCIFRSNMSGILQIVQFSGWSLLTAYCFFLTLGTVSFLSSLLFVKYMYTNVKID